MCGLGVSHASSEHVWKAGWCVRRDRGLGVRVVPCVGVYESEGLGRFAILVSIVASIPACHAGDPGSIPGRGAFARRSSSATRSLMLALAFARFPIACNDSDGPQSERRRV